MAEGPLDISGLLMAWTQGDDKALAEVMPALYPELRRIARRHLDRRPDHILESAALANEAYLKLIRAHNLHFENRMQFFALCAQIIRRIVVDYARNQGYAKRGGGAVQIALDEVLAGDPRRTAGVLALDDALVSLARIDPRKAQVVELRYFGGLSVEETAEVLHVSADTIKRDWRLAKVWLLREMRGDAR